jgi:kinesin family protein 5
MHPLTRDLVEQTLLSLAFLARCDWQTVGVLACVCKGWAGALFGEEQSELTWKSICQNIGANERLYVPPCYGKSWKTLFFDMLYSARTMWHLTDESEVTASSSETKSYQIQVFARIRPGDDGDDNDKLVLPLHQRLKLRRKGDKIGSDSFGLPVKTVRALLDSGVLQTGTDLPPEMYAALAEAADLDRAADGAWKASLGQDAVSAGEGEELDELDSTEAQALEEEAAVSVVAGDGMHGNIPDDEFSANNAQETMSEQPELGHRRPHVVVQRRHGNARLLTVKPAQVVMFIPGQGFRPFNFHHCFGKASEQAQVYEQSARDAVASVLNGFNASLLCYGQTGSGKTHTIFGPDKLLKGMMDGDDRLLEHKDAGVVLRAIAELIEYGVTLKDQQDNCGDNVVLSLSASYVEIYQETVTDLLSGAVVPVRDGMLVGAKAVSLQTLSDGLEMLKEGDARKSRAATNMNERSSRAHTMVVVKVIQTRPKLDAVVESQLALVDLAGCEQLKQSGAEGQRKLEAVGINSSLMVLRKCITALVEGKKHVPFYESKLTQLLRPAFSGNSRTTAVVCAAPEPSNGEQTLAALRFGEDCAMISTTALVAGVTSAKQALETINAAVARCKADLESLNARGKSHLPAYKKLSERFTRLKAKRSELEALEQQVVAETRGAQAKARRKAALDGVRDASEQDNKAAAAALAAKQQSSGGLFIPF